MYLVFICSLNIHVHKSHLLYATNISKYSAEDFKIKFWSHILEELFSASRICLKREDIEPKLFKTSNASSKVDLRILATTVNNKDASLDEFENISKTTKLYHDKLKLALISKFHLNALLKSNICLAYPFLMIMGFEFIFYCLDFDDGFYSIKEVDRCSFPITEASLKE
ncbi:hypothetical protein EDC94DRAFT_353617 [Helicostylum pulchrum]|nr:hypothetical protein EDC94DRAFT_353617 [Helicostylum pulchrum]